VTGPASTCWGWLGMSHVGPEATSTRAVQCSTPASTGPC